MASLPPSSRRPAVWAAAVLIAIHVGLAFVLRAPGLTTGGDDATYVLLGRSLQSFRYLDEFLVGAPVESQYPPLYPATLALIGMVFGERLGVFIAANITFSAAALLLVFQVTQRHSRPLALICLTLGAVNLDLVRMAGQIRSEPLFMVLVAGCLALLARPEPTRRSLVGAGALAIAAALTRGAGVAVVAAVIATWLVQRRWRPAGWLVAASLVTVGPWLAWTVVAPHQVAGRSYLADLMLPAPTPLEPSPPPLDAPTPTPPAGPEEDPTGARPGAPTVASSGPVGTVWHRVTTNLARYASRGLPDALGLPRVSGTDLDNWIWLFLVVAAGLAGLWSLGRWWPPVAATLISYGLLLMVWPYSVGRFLTPMLPLIILTLALGFAALVTPRPFALRQPVLAVAVFGGLVLIGSVPAVGRALQQSAQCDRERPLVSPGCFDPVERDFFSALGYIADSTPRSARFLTAKEGVFYYHTGRQVAPLPELVAEPRPDVRRYLARLGADYILLSHLKYDEWGLTGPLKAMCRELDMVRRFGPGTVLLRISAPAGPNGEAACDAIREYDRAPWGPRVP